MNTFIYINFQVLSFLFILFTSNSEDLFSSNNSRTISENYPKGEFIFPINPGSRASLSGTYGDIRFNHFHAGLDIRTGGIEGVSVYSAADGYVSRIGVSTGGYGNALYITHPNGYTTVYGHLKEFSSKIKEKLLEREYQQQSWEIDTYFQPGEIQVSKGEVVAFSGNTGGSGGPHLHFEIRNQAEETINPALFGFSEIVDNLAPVIVNVTLKPLDIYSRINGQFGEVTLTPIRLKNGDYVLNSNITAIGNIGVIVYAYDKSETSPFRLGITQINLKANNEDVFDFNLEKMSFATKIDMNTHTDYEKMVTQGVKSHRLYVEHGNRMNHYITNHSAGSININDTKVDIQVALKDTYQNASYLNFNILPETPSVVDGSDSQVDYSPKLIVSKFDDILRIQAIGKIDNNATAMFQFKGRPQQNINVAYKTANSQVYLYDLKTGNVDFVQIGSSTAQIDLNTYVSPTNQFASGNNYQIDFKNTLYKDLFLKIEELGNVLTIDKDVYPLKGRYKVSWQSNIPNCEKCGVYLSTSKSKFLESDKVGADFTFRPKEFGTYKILKDDIPPSIRVRSINSSEISFYISDNLSGIKNIACFVNNEWLMMEYEPKSSLIWSEKLNPDQPLQGKLHLTVEDNQGNTQVYERDI